MLGEETNLDSMRERREADERWESARRWRLFSIVLLFLLAGAVGGLAWYAYPILQQHAAALGRLPNLEQSIGAIRQDFNKADARVTELSAKQEYLRRNLEQSNLQMQSRIQLAGKRAEQAVAAALQKVQADLAAEIGALRTRVTNMESAREGDQTEIANLRQELTQVRGDMARQSDEFNAALAATRREMEGSGAAAQRQISMLRDDQQRAKRDVHEISNKLSVERVAFEVNKGHSQQLAPGISIGLTGTGTVYRRASGWMWIMPDRRTVWLRNQPAQEPVVFYGLQDGKRRELVITQVTKGSIAGYLILPKETASKETVSGPDSTAGAALSASAQ